MCVWHMEVCMSLRGPTLPFEASAQLGIEVSVPLSLARSQLGQTRQR